MCTSQRINVPVQQPSRFNYEGIPPVEYWCFEAGCSFVQMEQVSGTDSVIKLEEILCETMLPELKIKLQ